MWCYISSIPDYGSERPDPASAGDWRWGAAAGPDADSSRTSAGEERSKEIYYLFFSLRFFSPGSWRRPPPHHVNGGRNPTAGTAAAATTDCGGGLLWNSLSRHRHRHHRKFDKVLISQFTIFSLFLYVISSFRSTTSTASTSTSSSSSTGGGRSRGEQQQEQQGEELLRPKTEPGEGEEILLFPNLIHVFPF